MRIGFGRMGFWEPLIRQYADDTLEVEFVDLPGDMAEFDAVVPLQIFHYDQLSLCPALRGVKFIHPDPDTVALCDDKLRFAQFMTDNGFGDFVPRIRTTGAPYPYMWKKRHGVWGMNCRVISTADDEREQNAADDSWFAQDCVLGDIEYATNIMRVGGEIRYVSNYRHTMGRSVFVKGEQQSPLQTSYERDCKFIEVFRSILDTLGFEGTACFDYKVEADRPIIFELNPRCGGSMRADMNAYVHAYVEALPHH